MRLAESRDFRTAGRSAATTVAAGQLLRHSARFLTLNGQELDFRISALKLHKRDRLQSDLVLRAMKFAILFGFGHFFDDFRGA